MCTCIWWCKAPGLQNPRLQTEHRIGQLPLWEYPWVLKSPGVEKERPHSLHLWGFSYMYISRLQIDKLLSLLYYISFKCTTLIIVTLRYIIYNKKKITWFNYYIYDGIVLKDISWLKEIRNKIYILKIIFR